MRNKACINICLCVFMISILSVSGSAKEKTVDSMWAESPLNIDASNQEWTEAVLHFEKKYKVDCSFKNDMDNLYVLFIFKDPNFLSTVQATGMTLWFNTIDRKKKEYGINFGMKRVSADVLIAVLEKQKGPLPEEEKAQIKSRPQYFIFRCDVIDKKGNVVTDSVLTGDVMEPVFRSGKQQDLEIYEFRVPLAILGKLSDKLSAEPGAAVKVGFEWGGLTEAMKRARMKRLEQSGVRNPSATEPGAPSVSGSGGRGGGTGDLMGMRSGRGTPKKYSFWLDVNLAEK